MTVEIQGTMKYKSIQQNLTKLGSQKRSPEDYDV